MQIQSVKRHVIGPRFPIRNDDVFNVSQNIGMNAGLSYLFFILNDTYICYTGFNHD